MNISDLLSKDLIVAEIRSSKKSDVIRELAAHLAAHENLDPMAVGGVLLEREKLGSTALGEGIAIPHGKLATASRMAGCLGRSRKGIEFESVDGKPIHFVFALIAPEGAAGDHLKALARISRLFRNQDVRHSLLEAKSAAEIWTIIEREDVAASG